MTWTETAAAAAIATALSVGVIAQEKTMPTQHPMDKMDHKMDAPAAQPQAYVGCVAAGGETGTFVLRHPMPEVAMADTKMRDMHDGMASTPMKSESMKSDTMKGDAMKEDMHAGDQMHEPAMAPEVFRLAGSRLKNYAGRTVSVKGALTGGDGAAGQTAPTLKVKSIRVVSGTCSQAD
jgi:pentapeptide MXKDX repeat protein